LTISLSQAISAILRKVEIMALQVNIAEAKAKLSSLLDRALAGEEVVIARAGKPLARLTPMENMRRRKPGAWRGLKVSRDDLLAPMDPEDLDAAEGKHTDQFGITRRRSCEP
jgi:prevent-host-death family protein